MSKLIELTGDEIRVLETIMSKLNIPVSVPVVSKKKISKLDQAILNRNEYRANKKRKN